MRLGFGQLCLAPDQFWRMSPCEMQAALDGFYCSDFAAEGSAVLGRHEFNALSAQFPDQGEEGEPY